MAAAAAGGGDSAPAAFVAVPPARGALVRAAPPRRPGDAPGGGGPGPLRPLLQASLAAGAAAVAARRGREAARRGRPCWARPAGRRAPAVLEFGGVELHGEHARWLLAQVQSCGEFSATPIQQLAIRPLLSRRSACVTSPTGTGKTLTYLLPILERLGRITGRSKRAVIVAPSEDLQLQVGGVAQALMGERGSLVEVPTQFTRLTGQRLQRASVLVVTPSHLEDCTKLDGWPEFCTSLDALVLDEADSMLPPGGAKDWKMGALLRDLAFQAGGSAQKRAQRDELQLVVTSASMNVTSAELIANCFGISLEVYAAGATFVDEEEEADDLGPYGEDDGLWPPGISHLTMEWPPPQTRSKRAWTRKPPPRPEWVPPLMNGRHLNQNVAATAVARAFSHIRPEPQRCLVILSGSAIVAERGDGSSRVVERLRESFVPLGYDVLSARTLVEAASAQFSPNSFIRLNAPPAALAEATSRQVIVGRAETIRGIDIAGVDAVIIVGRLGTFDHYRHLAGRTGRCSPGQSRSRGGTVISILGPTDSRAIMNWRKRRLLDVRRTSVHGGPAEGAGAGGETFWEERTQASGPEDEAPRRPRGQGSLPRLKDDVPEPMETKPRRAQAMLPWDGIEEDWEPGRRPRPPRVPGPQGGEWGELERLEASGELGQDGDELMLPGA